MSAFRGKADASAEAPGRPLLAKCGNSQLVKMLNRCEEDVVSKLLPRFEGAIHSTADMGWGFHDSLRDTFEAYFPDA
jgi:hypothetical protein